MTELEINNELVDIRSELRLIDSILDTDTDTGEVKLTAVQGELVHRLFKLFNAMGWELQFSNHKQLLVADDPMIRTGGCKPGTPVRVRSCKEGHGTKTYFGILIGDVARTILHTAKDGVVTARPAYYNPAIIIPELGEIVYGSESWWSEIESEEDMGKLITDDTIQDVWYVQALKAMAKGLSNKDGVS